MNTTEPKIISRVFSEKGRENYDRIFRKDEEELKLLEALGMVSMKFTITTGPFQQTKKVTLK